MKSNHLSNDQLIIELKNLRLRNTELEEKVLELGQENKNCHQSEDKFRSLFENMNDGFAYHKIVVDKTGLPVDYVFLEVNNAFEKYTGLKKKKYLRTKSNKSNSGN